MIDYSDGKGVAMAKATIADIAREAQGVGDDRVAFY